MSHVERFRDWGRTDGPLPAGAPIATTDGEAAAVAFEALRRGGPPPVVGLLGGDLARTLGATGDRARLATEAAVWVPVDVIEARLDGEVHVSVAHLVARRAWWRGRAWIAASAEWLGEWDLTPRSHPGDGRIEIVEASVRWGQRRQVARRLRTGSHLPHPDLHVHSAPMGRIDLDRPTPVWVDGRRIGTATVIEVEVRPGALIVVI